jgi:hypothetical protein
LPYIALAKLRLNAALENDSGTQLDPARLRSIRAPLFAARALNRPWKTQLDLPLIHTN